MSYHVVIDEDLKDLAVEYIQNRKRQVPELEAAFARKDFSMIATAAHNMKGVAASYGFPALGELGAALEASADSAQAEAVATLLAELKAYVAGVQMEFQRVEAA